MGDLAGAPVKIEFVAGARSRGAGTFRGETARQLFRAVHGTVCGTVLRKFCRTFSRKTGPILRERWRTSVSSKKSDAIERGQQNSRRHRPEPEPSDGRCAGQQGERARARVRAARTIRDEDVNELLTEAGMSMDDFHGRRSRPEPRRHRADRSPNSPSPRSRRNATLREIDRRRASLGETLRRSVQEIEDDEFKEIETTTSQRKKRRLTSDRKIKANRANAQASTGPQNRPGPRSHCKKRASPRAQPSRLFQSSIIRGGGNACAGGRRPARQRRNPRARAPSRRSEIDLRRVRNARHQLLSAPWPTSTMIHTQICG